jgi:protein-disulfide isomerase
MVSTLLGQQKNWIGADDPIAALKNYARLAGISASDFDLIMSDRPFLEALVDIRQQAIRNFKISSTPSFVVNDDTSFSGSLDYDSFLAEVNKAGL